MPKEGFKSITIKEELLELFDNVRAKFKDRPAFLVDLLDFWVKYHCPECGEETAVKQRNHKC